MRRFLIKSTGRIKGERLIVELSKGLYGLPMECVEVIDDDTGASETEGKSMHSIGLMLDKRNVRIRDLERQVAALKVGAQPASKVRDLVLVVLKQLAENLRIRPLDMLREASIEDVQKLIASLGSAFPGEVEHRENAGKMVDRGGVKPYVPLDNGPRDVAAAAPEYQAPPDLRKNTK